MATMGDSYFQKSRPQWQAVEVPLAVRHPDHLESRICTTLVEITDITATILDIAGLTPRGPLPRLAGLPDRIPCRA